MLKPEKGGETGFCGSRGGLTKGRDYWLGFF